jgi:hypothetical protein
MAGGDSPGAPSTNAARALPPSSTPPSPSEAMSFWRAAKSKEAASSKAAPSVTSPPNLVPRTVSGRSHAFRDLELCAATNQQMGMRHRSYKRIAWLRARAAAPVRSDKGKNSDASVGASSRKGSREKPLNRFDRA